jgi:hypothetical protein
MRQIADLTYSFQDYVEIMRTLWERIEDDGKNWRHVYKVRRCSFQRSCVCTHSLAALPGFIFRQRGLFGGSKNQLMIILISSCVITSYSTALAHVFILSLCRDSSCWITC